MLLSVVNQLGLHLLLSLRSTGNL